MHKFNVFGKEMIILRKNNEWLLFNESLTGIRTRVYDVIIPADLSSQELTRYLDDIYHEYSTQQHPHVIPI